jgi:hypothetical protein
MQSDLAAFQRAFAASVSTGAPSQFDAFPGFAVFRNTSAAAAIDALGCAYSATRAILGETSFRSVALAYFRDEPPRMPVLADYGRDFADWLDMRRDASYPTFLSDVARIDRLQLEAHLAADPEDCSGLNASEISDDAWLKVVAELHPATRFHWFERPAPSIWIALREATPPEDVAPAWKAEGILLTRPAGAVEAFAIDCLEFELLASFADGECVGEAAIAAAHRRPNCDIGARFKRLLQSGAIHQFRPKERKQ